MAVTQIEASAIDEVDMSSQGCVSVPLPVSRRWLISEISGDNYCCCEPCQPQGWGNHPLDQKVRRSYHAPDVRCLNPRNFKCSQ